MNKTLSKAVLTIVFSLASLSANAEYTLSWLDGLGGAALTSQALSINGSGQIVGYSSTADGSTHATVWNNGVPTDLGTLGGTLSVAYKINASGQIVGYSSTADGSIRATVWNNGVPNALTTRGGTLTEAFDINASGQIVGNSDSANGYNHATVWNNGVPTDLGTLGGSYSYASGINASGQIVGYSSTADGSIRATVWNNGVPTDLGTLGGSISGAYDINASGQIVGSSLTNEGSYEHATLWNNGVPTDLGSASVATSINASGQIVGFSYNGTAPTSAMLWYGTYKIDLNNFISDSEKASGWMLNKALGINDYGSIVGVAYNGTIQRGFLLSVTPVPEADSSAMLLTGLGVIGFMVRRRKNIQA